MTQRANNNGAISENRSTICKYGPYYLQGLPPLPVGPKKAATGVAIVPGKPTFNLAADVGWIYSPVTGEIKRLSETSTPREFAPTS